MNSAGPALLALLLAAAPAWSQAARDESALRELVRRLGDPDSKVRDRAEEDLRGEGARAERVLLEARKSDDAEVRLRVERLLREYERRAKRDRLRAVADPPLLVLAPGNLPFAVHHVDLKTGKARQLVDYSTTLSDLQRDDLTGRVAFYMQKEGLQILSPGSAEAETVTPLQVRSPRGVAWSPAGDTLVLVSATKGIPALNLFTLSSKELVRLTPEGQGHFEPSWSPDGKEIAFVRNDGMGAKGADVYRMTVAAPRTVQRLTTDGASKLGTTWSPDGKWIAFAWVDEPSLGVVSASVPNAAPRRLGPEGEQPAWSPDSSSLAYIRNLLDEKAGELRIVDREGKTDRVIAGGAGLKGHPAWSPDGKRIAFDWMKGEHPQVFVVNADGTGLLQVTSLPEGATWPVWAPQE